MEFPFLMMSSFGSHSHSFFIDLQRTFARKLPETIVQFASE